MHQDFLIKGDLCYSKDPQTLHTLPDSYLVCVDGQSRGVFAAPPTQYAQLPIHDYSGKLVIPGLCGLHMHAPQFSFRGLGMDLELLDWLNTHTFPEEAKYNDLEYADRAYSDVVEELKRGPNTRACLFATVHPPATELLMDKLERSGLVTMVGKVNMDRNCPDSLRESDAMRSAAATRRWLDRCNGKYRNTTPILTPRFIPSCTDELLRELAIIAREYDLPVQSHLSENQSEIAWVQTLRPDSRGYLDAYIRCGLFDPRRPGILAHCTWSDNNEVALLKRRGIFVAHCPQSNTNLASGIAPVRAFLKNGLSVGLGSDVAGGCHTSIFRAMADAIQVSKLRWRLVDDSLAPLTAAEAFYLGTKGGGAFFGKVGSFEEGYELDAVVIDDNALRAPFDLSLSERLERAIYLSDDRHIHQKYVRGIMAR